MRDLTPYWFTLGEGPEKFQLRPLDTATHWELQSSMVGRYVPTWQAVEATVRACVVGWSGITQDGADLPFSPNAKQAALAPTADPEWMGRWMAVAGELLRRANLTEDEAKKS
jgi:hypothetical protein